MVVRMVVPTTHAWLEQPSTFQRTGMPPCCIMSRSSKRTARTDPRLVEGDKSINILQYCYTCTMHNTSHQTSPNSRFLDVRSTRQPDKNHKKKHDSQNLRSLAEWVIPPDHLSRPNIPQEPTDMADGTSDQVTCGSFPRATDNP